MLISIQTIRSLVMQENDYKVISRLPFPPRPEYPDADSYDLLAPGTIGKPYSSISLTRYENREELDEAVKFLKRIYDIVDPWDKDPDYFDNYELNKNPVWCYVDNIRFNIEAEYQEWMIHYSLKNSSKDHSTLLATSQNIEMLKKYFKKEIQLSIKWQSYHSLWKEKFEKEYNDINYSPEEMARISKSNNKSYVVEYSRKKNDLENLIKFEGEYLTLQPRNGIGKNLSSDWANYHKYKIYNHYGEYIIVTDPCVHDMIKALKRVHNIVDPWDLDPEYFKDFNKIKIYSQEYK